MRFALGAALIVTTAAAATATGGLILFESVAREIRPIPGPDLPPPEAGSRYTILLLGSDRRQGAAKDDQRSDTTMLLRLDPDRGVISLLSLPRDLLVEIPGHGTDKLNAAYSAGGPQLTRKAVERLTGLDVNEIVDVDFQGFADAVNAVGCVYVDVDQDYYLPPGTGVTEIDINAGYQRLCGLKALQYVRYRHTDNDIVRGARQQAFLREARQRIDVGELVLGGGGRDLLEAFVDNTSSTIDGGDDVRAIARSLFDLRGESVNQLEIEGDLGPTDITVRDGEVDRAVAKFLNGPGDADGSGGSGGDGGGKGGGGSKRGGGGERELPPADPHFAKYARTAERRLGFPAYYPTQLPSATTFSDDSRTYEYEDEHGDKQRAYKLVMARPHPSIVTEYYGIMGTTWDDPPILARPTEKRSIGGREFLLFWAGARLRLVGWKEGGNSYWVSNSLLGSLSENEMLGIATGAARASDG